MSQFTSLSTLGKPDGAPAEVLVIALALVMRDVTSGDQAKTQRWTEAVIASSTDYETGMAWSSPESWRRADQFVMAEL